MINIIAPGKSKSLNHNAGKKKEQVLDGSFNFLISAEIIFCIQNPPMLAFFNKGDGEVST